MTEGASERDEWGMTRADWSEIRAENERIEREQRGRALRALWARPVVDHVRRDGVVCYRDNRDEEWTFWRGLKLTLALLLDRQWVDPPDPTCKRIFGTSLAFWDSRQTYGGYDVMVVQLYPGCRFEIFSDGECLM